MEYPYYTKLLAGIDQLLKKGLHVILLAHDVSYNVNLESGEYYSRTRIAAPAGDNTNVVGLLEARAHNVFFIQGENPTTVVKGAGGKNKQVATSGAISRVIYTKPAGTFFAKSRVNLEHFYEIDASDTEEDLLKHRANPSLIKLWEDVYK